MVKPDNYLAMRDELRQKLEALQPLLFEKRLSEPHKHQGH
jgi:hypothetical protein